MINLKHLMLREDVVESAAAGRFHIDAVEKFDQGVEILIGVTGGIRDESRSFPEAHINERVPAKAHGASWQKSGVWGARRGCREVTERRDEIAVRLILVALDASRESLAALEVAAELAAGLKAELLGLFVERADVFRLSELSFARAIEYASGTEQRLESPEMERMLQIQAARAERALAATAERAHVPWSFRVARGQLTGQVLTAVKEADVLILGEASRPAGKRVGKPVLVVYNGSVASRHALVVAARLAQTDHDALSVLVMAGAPEAIHRLADEAIGLLEGRGVRARYHSVVGRGAQALARAVKAEGGGMLVLGGNSPLLEQREMQQLVDDLEWPTLLVR